jgi:hypothetical protein
MGRPGLSIFLKQNNAVVFGPSLTYQAVGNFEYPRPFEIVIFNEI